MRDELTVPTARQNEATARDLYSRIDADDIPGLCALLSPDIVYSRPGYPDMAGRDAVEHFYREDRRIRDGRHRITGLVATGEQVAVHGDFDGTLRDGHPARHGFAEFFTVAPDGLISGRRTFFFVPLV
jgi:steroid Delta-isomerase